MKYITIAMPDDLGERFSVTADFLGIEEERLARAALEAYMRTWEEKFDVEIGIPTTNTQKKERLVTGEVEANQAEAETRLKLWFEGLEKSFEDTRNMFGLSESELSVEMRRQEGGIDNGDDNINNDGDVSV